jgi:hypothetical protein
MRFSRIAPYNHKDHESEHENIGNIILVVWGGVMPSRKVLDQVNKLCH